MPIENFDPKEFAKNLVQQAVGIIPKDLNENQKNFIIGKINHLCIEAGDFLNNSPNIKLNANQASTVIQFIAEWTFHKGIDLIRSEIPHEHWNNILNNIAQVIFNTATKTIVSGMDDDSIINQVEKEVAASFEWNLRELIKAGKLKEEDIPTILKQSNIDQMADTIKHEEKTLKLISIAILLKSMHQEKAEKILANLAKEEANQIINFMKTPDLGKNLNQETITKFLNDFKKNLSLIQKDKKDPDLFAKNIKNLLNSYTEKDIKNIIKFERKNIKNYIEYCLTNNPSLQARFSSYISQIIFNYLKLKLSA
ncbi:MAG: hypothetical protein V2B14_04620 [bacterium]